MSKGNTIGAIILGVAAGVALLKFFSMPEDERQEFISHLKNKAHDLLDDAEGTVEKVKQHFGSIVKGEVNRFELPNLKALNFLLHESLGGGGTLSLMTDAQGKTFSTALLRMHIEIQDAEAFKLGFDTDHV